MCIRDRVSCAAEHRQPAVCDLKRQGRTGAAAANGVADRYAEKTGDSACLLYTSTGYDTLTDKGTVVALSDEETLTDAIASSSVEIGRAHV